MLSQLSFALFIMKLVACVTLSPYLHLSNTNGMNITDMILQTQIKSLTVAFANIDLDEGQLSWGLNIINEARTIGGKDFQIRLSFGGAVAHSQMETAFFWTDPTIIQKAYQKVIDLVKPNAIDFDIEQKDEWTFDENVVHRRSQAIAQLRIQNNNIPITFTVSSNHMNGLSPLGKCVVQSAIDYGIKFGTLLVII
ncbi:hypothetical protein HDV02_001832 [Globomyces sp. JEL0801]|nr:hypothetical protein HDV02_001832 [Globomyces sp. JEL0801]